MKCHFCHLLPFAKVGQHWWEGRGAGGGGGGCWGSVYTILAHAQPHLQCSIQLTMGFLAGPWKLAGLVDGFLPSLYCAIWGFWAVRHKWEGNIHVHQSNPVVSQYHLFPFINNWQPKGQMLNLICACVQLQVSVTHLQNTVVGVGGGVLKRNNLIVTWYDRLWWQSNAMLTLENQQFTALNVRTKPLVKKEFKVKEDLSYIFASYFETVKQLVLKLSEYSANVSSKPSAGSVGKCVILPLYPL